MEVKLKFLFLILTIHCTALLAVTVSPDERGEVLIIPYYTVNNGLNTLVSVNNTTEASKALKVTFREGTTGQAVFTYNVYLAVRDVWSFGVIPGDAQIPGLEGLRNVIHVYADNSCTPFLPWSQEFNAVVIDGVETTAGNLEGYIEVMEMGELSEPLTDWVRPPDWRGDQPCQQVELAFTGEDPSAESGFWNPELDTDLQQHITPPTGGISAEAFLIDVENGLNFAFEAVALTDFYPPGETFHRLPDDSSLSLDAAGGGHAWIGIGRHPLLIQTSGGWQAVAAALRAEELIATYDLTPLANGHTEVVTTFPLRRFAPAVADTSCLAAQGDDINLDWLMYGRNGHLLAQSETPLTICHNVWVTSLTDDDGQDASDAELTGTMHHSQLLLPASGNEPAGHLRMKLNGSQLVGIGDEGTPVDGLIMGQPLVGMVLQSYSNAAASQGLLAQYASCHPLVRKSRVLTNQLIQAESEETHR